MTADRFPQTLGRHRSAHAAFSLVELLVALTILSGLMVAVFSIMSSASNLTNTSRQTNDCDSEARDAFGQIAYDLRRRVLRADVSAYADKKTGNDRFYLFAEAPGYSPDVKSAEKSPFSLIGYRIQEVNGRLVLQRYARALPWGYDTANQIPLPYVQIDRSGNTPVPIEGTYLASTFPKVISQDTTEDTFYQVLAQNIVRIEFSFFRKLETATATETGTTVDPASMVPDSEIVNELNTYGLSRIKAVVVNLAIIDPQNMARTNIETLKGIFDAPTFDAQTPTGENVQLPGAIWLREFASQAAQLPAPVRMGMRFYQRVIKL